jgi:class 3 adenylate cyclase
VNLAARLCALAGPGELHIGPRAYELIHPRPAVPQRTTLKGMAGSVLVHRVPAVTSI